MERVSPSGENASSVGNASGAGRRCRSFSTFRMKGNPLQVLVRDNNIEQALKVLKKKLQREGVFREMKARRAYEKPYERRGRDNAEAIRPSRKAAPNQAVREGQIAGPRRAAG